MPSRMFLSTQVPYEVEKRYFLEGFTKSLKVISTVRRLLRAPATTKPRPGLPGPRSRAPTLPPAKVPSSPSLTRRRSAPPLRSSSSISSTMPESGTLPDEQLAHQADIAWQYRERHREIINKKAAERQRQRREAICNAPNDVKLLHRIRARNYRRTYRALGLVGKDSAGSDSDRSNDVDEDTVVRCSGRGRRVHNEEDVEEAACRVFLCSRLCC
ncbi:hypothetical protein R3P38DRAFT_2794802 [Favolaschia claudopus]|uniref:Uncharacterized protein n=1 Tax=Favolaschia claudopus TaxID=2862362 RepID=A0AAW0A7V1_9AGAR